MTTYTDREESAHDASPVEGYFFQGTFKNYYYTSAETGVSINGQSYTPIVISRSAIAGGNQGGDGSDLELTLPYDIQLVQDYAYEKVPPELLLTIYRYHEGTNPATDWVPYWKGEVASFLINGHFCTIRVPSIFSIVMSGEIPRVYHHRQCNHVLYDARCGVASASWKQSTTIVSVDNNVIEVADDGFADGVLVGGELVIPSKSERRLINSNVSDIVTVNFPFYDAEAGDTVDLYAGCDHTFSTCVSKFSNGDNFGGFPFMPGDNPFESEL